MTMRITYVDRISGKPSSKQFPDTRGGYAKADEEWTTICESPFTMFAVFMDDAAPTRYFAPPAVVRNCIKDE